MSRLNDIQLRAVTGEAVLLLEKIKGKIHPGSDMMWTAYETAEELEDDLAQRIAELKENNFTHLDNLYSHFVPTSTLQEHSLMNGWADEYLRLAECFDKIYESLKQQ